MAEENRAKEMEQEMQGERHADAMRRKKEEEEKKQRRGGDFLSEAEAQESMRMQQAGADGDEGLHNYFTASTNYARLIKAPPRGKKPAIEGTGRGHFENFGFNVMETATLHSVSKFKR